MSRSGCHGEADESRSLGRVLVIWAVFELTLERVERREVGHDMQDVAVLTDEIRTSNQRCAQARDGRDGVLAGCVEPGQLPPGPAWGKVPLDEPDASG